MIIYFICSYKYIYFLRACNMHRAKFASDGLLLNLNLNCCTAGQSVFMLLYHNKFIIFIVFTSHLRIFLIPDLPVLGMCAKYVFLFKWRLHFSHLIRQKNVRSKKSTHSFHCKNLFFMRLKTLCELKCMQKLGISLEHHKP